ncbi:MAG: acyl dehydratase [Chloroflexi bacterium RIFCSPLOWO2_12_FULL_71_12]|nr:MAG: acyl dehydratase [Chloroflexi bacterium RIFCSPLOWO2_12_FULL_71_12]
MSEGGRVFEDYVVGKVFRHPVGRTVTDTDNIWFTNITMNMNPVHFDAHYASQTEFKKPLVNSCFTLALVTGLSVVDIDHAFANLGWDEVRLPAPVFEGDTIYAQSEVLEARESRSRPSVGIVKLRTTGFKQDGTVVITFLRTVMVYRRGHVPKIPQPTPIQGKG